jgi:four helix bundle protein
MSGHENIVAEKSFCFAIRIVRLYQYLSQQKQEKIMSRQLLKSGTSIGANIREAIRGQSRNDFVSKLNIALKEASETEYWIELLYRTDYITEKEYNSISGECKELNKILISIVRTTKSNEQDT